jgi:hypothetical protein
MEAIGMEKLKKEINEWREFVIKDIMKEVKKELNEDIEALLDGLREHGFLKER